MKLLANGAKLNMMFFFFYTVEPTRRKSSEQEDKTHPVELCDEKTGPVREELRKVAEGLLPAETRPDIYGIKAALQGDNSLEV